MEAVGTETDSILFTAADTIEGWHGIRFVDAPDSSHLSYCIVEYGKASGTSIDDNCGGGFFCDNSNPIFRNCSVTNNSASMASVLYHGGGGVYCKGGSNAEISSCTIMSNKGHDGGGVYCNGSSPVLRSCVISSNYANASGGGIFCNNLSVVTVESTVLSENIADVFGGGIACLTPNYASVVLDSSTLAGNQAEKGGGISLDSGCIGEIVGCMFSGNHASLDGGGIYCFNSQLIVGYSTIVDNQAPNNYGGGVYMEDCENNHFFNNVVQYNVAGHGAGIIWWCEDGLIENNDISYNESIVLTAGGISIIGSPIVQNNILNWNITPIESGHCIDMAYSSNPIIQGNQICYNNRGAIGASVDSSPELINNTICNNGTQAFWVWSNSHQFGRNNIIYGNGSPFVIYGGCSITLEYSLVEGGWPGTGNIDTDPLFVDPENSDYHLQSIFGSYHGGAWLPDLNNSPCIDAGDPASPYENEPDPNGGRINMGAYGNTLEASKSNLPSYLDVSIDLTYVSGSPVPQGGGNLIFDLFVSNNEPLPVNYDAWLELAYEGGDPQTMVLRHFDFYQPGWTINRPAMWFPIIWAYPAGNYTFTGKVGEHPDIAWDESGFPFVKLGVSDGSEFIPYLPDTEFPNPFDEIITTAGEIALPTTFTCNAYPNPFNPSTAISIQLSAFSEVNLSVFDISGRLVAELVDGWREAGVHRVIFDGSGLASGVYIYRLSSQEFRVSGKTLLLR
ncbi:MAG: right-handed parallel beta-helix repeat-containing protein [bacterium]